jgi:hypothetical protein
VWRRSLLHLRFIERKIKQNYASCRACVTTTTCCFQLMIGLPRAHVPRCRRVPICWRNTWNRSEPGGKIRAPCHVRAAWQARGRKKYWNLFCTTTTWPASQRDPPPASYPSMPRASASIHTRSKPSLPPGRSWKRMMMSSVPPPQAIEIKSPARAQSGRCCARSIYVGVHASGGRQQSKQRLYVSVNWGLNQLVDWGH